MRERRSLNRFSATMVTMAVLMNPESPWDKGPPFLFLVFHFIFLVFLIIRKRMDFFVQFTSRSLKLRISGDHSSCLGFSFGGKSVHRFIIFFLKNLFVSLAPRGSQFKHGVDLLCVVSELTIMKRKSCLFSPYRWCLLESAVGSPLFVPIFLWVDPFLAGDV